MNRESGGRAGAWKTPLGLGVTTICLTVLAVVTFTVAVRIQQGSAPAATRGSAAPQVPAVAATGLPAPTVLSSLTPTPTPTTSAKPQRRPPKAGRPTAGAVTRASPEGKSKIKQTAKAAAAPARPANLAPGHLRLTNLKSGRCLDSGPPPSAGAQGLPYTLPCNGTKYQQWSALPVQAGSRVVLLRDAQTMLCLTVSPNTQGATRNCDLGDASLQWKWQGSNADSVYVQVSTGSCLTGDAGQDVMPGPCGGDYQHWRQS